MKRLRLLFTGLALLFFSCNQNQEIIKPSEGPITESVYASASVKSVGQYQVYPGANGILSEALVDEGNLVSKGGLMFTIVSDAAQLNREQAELNSRFSD